MNTAALYARDADGEEHVAELADRGVREHPFDVGLHDRDRAGEERGDAADPRDDRRRVGARLEERVRAAQEEHARGDHGGRVDQRGDRRRAFHRVGQPEVQRDLRALPDRREQQQQRDRGRGARSTTSSAPTRHRRVVERAGTTRR